MCVRACACVFIHNNQCSFLLPVQSQKIYVAFLKSIRYRIKIYENLNMSRHSIP